MTASSLPAAKAEAQNVAALCERGREQRVLLSVVPWSLPTARTREGKLYRW